jgi:hypothetical protein
VKSVLREKKKFSRRGMDYMHFRPLSVAQLIAIHGIVSIECLLASYFVQLISYQHFSGM